MSLSAELALTLRPIRFPDPAKSRLRREVEKLGEMFGGLPREEEHRPDVVKAASAALARGPDAVAELSLPELKAVPYVLWSRDEWRDDAGLIASFLARADEIWRGAVRRLWRHHFLHLDPTSVISRELGRWLTSRRDSLPSRVAEFSEKYRVCDPVAGMGAMVTAAMSDSAELVQEAASIGIPPERLRGTSLLVGLLQGAGERLPDARGENLLIERITALAGENVDRALEQAGCSTGRKQRARRALVEGVVRRQRRLDPSDAEPKTALDFVLALNGDPRFQSARWNGVIAPEVVEAVQKWLSRVTMEAFFRIIDQLQTDSPHMWRERRHFWMGYLPHVRSAWLVVGSNADALAKKDRAFRYGVFEKEAEVLPDHCGLLMQVGDLVVLEMNMNGAALFWKAGARNTPPMHAARYERSRLRASGGTRLTHQGAWQGKFATHILTTTGLYRTR